jgi:hypothetical protein
MPRDERHRQKALARKASRRKDKRQVSVRHDAPARRTGLGAAADWPLHECVVSRTWKEPGELVQILVARRAGDEIAAAGFLVDLGCLGVKDALSHVLSRREYEGFRQSFTSLQPMMRADLNLAAKIIQEAIAYAQRFGFSPHPDYRAAAALLADADPAACHTEIPLGIQGKPFFVPGPHDNVAKITKQLERAVGPSNFHYVFELDAPIDAIGSLTGEEEPDEQPTSLFPRLLRRLRPG